MYVRMNMDYLRGHLRYGHKEGNVDFTLDQEEDFKNLLSKEINEETLTEEELDRLEEYKEIIIDETDLIVDDWEVDDCGDYQWGDIF